MLRSLLLLLLLALVSAPALWSHAQAMRRIESRSTPAHQASLKFMRGVNTGNYLEYNPGHAARNATYSAHDFAVIRQEGFDHVRIPVGWHLHAGPAPNYELSGSIFSQVDALVNAALAQGLAVIVDLHHFDDFMRNPGSRTEEFHAIWRQVAQHYAGFPDTLAFELLNEPMGALTTDLLNRLYADAIRRIRASNPRRTIFLGPANYNSIDELKTDSGQGLQLPNEDQNLIVTVHSYEPYFFTHQGAEWALPDTATVGVVFPGPPPTPVNPDSRIKNSWVLEWFSRYNRLPDRFNPCSPLAIRGQLSRARNWSEFYGRPVHVGEFGCYFKADNASRVRYHEAARQFLDEFSLGWALWDWKSGFHYSKNGRPDPPGMREALFPGIQISASAKGVLEFNGAVGKTYVVERALSLVPPVAWQPIESRTLKTPEFLFADPESGKLAGAYYRVKWLK